MKKIILFIGIISCQLLFAQDISFKSMVSKNRLGVNERLRVTFSIDKQGGDDFSPPDFKNFKVLSGPMTATNFSYINGKKSFEQSYSYTIQPINIGVYTISEAEITINGKKLKSNMLKITVTGAVEIPKDANDPRYLASQNIHLIAEISNSNPYVGESISVVYKIYVDVNEVNVRNTREVESPSFNGFWNQNIEVNQWEAKDGSFQGKPHRYAVIKKTVLIPQKAGKLSIDPMEIEITAGIPVGRRDLFGNMITKNIAFTATTGKRFVNVKPLPKINRPLDFSGAVGEFSFKISSNKTALKANEPAQIRVEVAGKGNLKLIELPKIETPNGLERYEPEHKENIVTTLGGLRGGVYDEYTVIPQFRGKFKVPEVSFSYFSLEEESYKTLVSKPIIINASQGKSAVAVSDANNGNNLKRDVIANAKGIRYISNVAVWRPTQDKKDFLNSTLFYTLLIMPFLSIPIGMFIGVKKKERDDDVVGNKRRKADRLAKKYLSEAKKQLGKKEQFYIALEKALHNYLKAKLRIETSEFSKERIVELLKNKQVTDATIVDFIKVLEDCDFARYSPTTNVMMQEEYHKASSVISKLDKHL